MRQYSLILVASLVLFSGCGDGGAKETALSPSSSPQNITAIEQSLRNAGYTGASDVAELGTNTIAFTYFNGNNKHFVIYNKEKGEILSDIPSFEGNTLINNNGSSVTFDNGTTVNVDNYTKPTIETVPTNTTNTKTPKEMINDQLPSGQYVSQFVYTPQRQGAGVLIKEAGSNDILGLYLYGLKNTIPERQFLIYSPEEDGEQIKNISIPKSGELKFTVTYNGWTYHYSYNYFKKQLSDPIVINPSGDYVDSGTTSTNTKTPIEMINDQLPSGQYVSQFVYTPQRQGAGVLIKEAGSNDILGLYLYGLKNTIPERQFLIYSPEEDGEKIKNISIQKSGELKFTVTYNGWTYHYSYNYFKKQLSDPIVINPSGY